jgi:hypothetical protein
MKLVEVACMQMFGSVEKEYTYSFILSLKTSFEIV